MLSRIYLIVTLWLRGREYKNLDVKLESNLKFLKALKPCIHQLYNETAELHVYGDFGFETIDMFLYLLDRINQKLAVMETLSNDLTPSIRGNRTLFRKYLRTADDQPVNTVEVISIVIDMVDQTVETLNAIESNRPSMGSYYRRVLKAIEYEFHVLTKTMYEGVVLSHVR